MSEPDLKAAIDAEVKRAIGDDLAAQLELADQNVARMRRELAEWRSVQLQWMNARWN
jgi:hypothetical protein